MTLYCFPLYFPRNKRGRKILKGKSLKKYSVCFSLLLAAESLKSKLLVWEDGSVGKVPTTTGQA